MGQYIHIGNILNIGIGIGPEKSITGSNIQPLTLRRILLHHINIFLSYFIFQTVLLLVCLLLI